MPASDQRILAASPFCFVGFDPWVAYAYLKKAGVRYVEVPAVSQPIGLKFGLTTFAPEAMDAGDVGAMRARLAEMGLQPISLDAVCQILTPRDVASLRSRIDFAADLGCTYVITDSCTEEELKKYRKEVMANLRSAADYAASRGVRIALETHDGPTKNGRAAKEFFAELAHPNVGINYDTGNILYYNDNIDPADDIREIADKVIHVHLKDTQGGKKEWKFCSLGDGRVDFGKIVSTLDSAGFRGPYSIEIEGIEGEDLNREQCMQRLLKSAAHLKKVGLSFS
jgi:L-ribulose-5-phosphate 3-epimerase